MIKTYMAIALSLFLISNANAATTNGQDGYISRPCGFDNDKDGDYGEAGECDYCDGTGVTPDPDQDGNNEDEIYINCQTGTDNAGCGASTAPCKSLEYALTKTNGTSYGGAEEDIMCVAGTCGSYNGGLTPGSIGITVTQDGKCDGTNCANSISTRNANVGPDTGNAEEYNYEYPDDPFMIVGWDTDNDGEYPPYDTDQPYPAIFDGCANANQLDTCTSNSGNELFQLAQSNRFEMAHLTIANVGVVPEGNSTQINKVALRWSGSYSPTHHRIHDIRLYRNILNVPGFSDHRTIGFSISGGNSSKWMALENLLLEKNGGWGFRGWMGSGGGSRGTKLRFKNVTITAHDNTHSVNVGPASGNSIAAKWWSVDGAEMIDNLIQDPDRSGNSQTGLYISKMSHNVFIRSNTIKNYSHPIRSTFRDTDSENISGNNGLSDGLYIDRNYIYWTSGFGSYSAAAISINSDSTNGQERTECPATNPCSGSAEPCTADGGAGGNQDCDCNTQPMYRTNVEVTNNIIDAANNSGIDMGIAYKLGENCHNTDESNFGPGLIANNTFKNWNPGSSDSSGSPRGAIVIGRVYINDWDYKYVKGNVYVFNNLVTGMNNDVAVQNIKRGANGCGPTTGTSCTPASNYGTGDWFAGNNVFQGSGVSYLRGEDCSTNADCSGTGVCGGGDRCLYSSLSAWQSVTGQDANSKTCSPTFDSSGFRLASSDTCAKNAGSNTYCPAKDFDGQSRSDGNCDIGADEETTGGGGPFPGVLKLTASSYTVSEGVGTLSISVSRTSGDDDPASVQYSVSNGTATGGASCSGSTDFITTSGTLNWSDNDSANKSFTITICDDLNVESNETILIQLFNPSGATLDAPSAATVTITNNDVAAGQMPTIDTANIKTTCSQTDGTVFTLPSVAVVGGVDRINRALVVLVGAEGTANNGDPLCDLSDSGSTVVWGSQPMTRLATAKGLNGSVGACSGAFYLLNPQPGTATVTVTFAATALDVQITAVPMYNVAQKTPLSFDAASTGSGQAGSPITTGLTTIEADTILIDALTLGERVGGGNIVPGGGQTELADLSCGSAGSHTGVSSKQAPNTGTNSMSWSWTLQSGETSAYRYAHTIAGFVFDDTVDSATTTTTVPVTTTLPPDPTAPTIGHICILPCMENQ